MKTQPPPSIELNRTQVARILGVSEGEVLRLTTAGELKFRRTAGQHRRGSFAEVSRYQRNKKP